MLQSIKNILGIGRFKLTPTNQHKQYSCGQVWKYKTRHHEPHSRLTIVQIDQDIKNTPIFHIHINGLDIKNPHHPDGILNTLPHSPVALETLDCSVIELDKILADFPDQFEGYSEWLKSWEQGKAGIFSLPIKDMIDFVEKSLCMENE